MNASRPPPTMPAFNFRAIDQLFSRSDHRNGKDNDHATHN
jgi:hypothetical protein